MSNWQYLVQGSWISLNTKQKIKLDNRYECPTLDPIRLKTPLGILTGIPETLNMKFKIHGDSEFDQSKIRRGPKPGDLPIIEIVDGNYPRVLSLEASQTLFDSQNKPNQTSVIFEDSTEVFLSKKGKIFQGVDGNMIERNFEISQLSHHQFEDITKTQYQWEFKGPFRWEKMRMAVQKTCEMLSTEQKCKLKHLFSNFDPSEDATEYGPYQFEDYLSDNGEIELSLSLMGQYNSINSNIWKPLDTMTNARIENSRASKKPATVIKVRGHMYLLMFDSGSGASGSEPVLIRAGRYQKILESIEEQFQEQGEHNSERRQLTEELFHLLVTHNHNPNIFIMSAFVADDPLQNIHPHIRPRVEEILDSLRQSNEREGLSTRIQQFLPVLLEKFKECEIRMVARANTEPPKKLSEKISNTMKTGLSVPKSFRCSWKKMLVFIAEKQCWETTFEPSICDICMQKSPTLKHCGGGSACLKCWSQMVINTNFTCPFCRQDIEEGQLKLKTPVKENKKRKRKSNLLQQECKIDIKTVLETIRKDELYTSVDSQTSFSMKKWFVILLRRGLVKIHQMPKHEQAAKTLDQALVIFKLS